MLKTQWPHCGLIGLPLKPYIQSASEIAAVLQAELEQAVQAHLDTSARVKGYDDILSACTYANSANATFKAEGMEAVAWRDAVWTYCYGVLAAAQAGTRQIPTEAELISELKLQCPLVW